MTTTLTPAEKAALTRKAKAFIMPRHIVAGLGTEGESCSVGDINLAWGRGLTDMVPPEMSEVIGRWIIRIQDVMPDAVRNSTAWKAALVKAATSGRDPKLETKRFDAILAHMTTVTLPTLQPIADKYGFGSEWKAIHNQQSAADAGDAADAACAADAADAACAAYAAGAAYAARAAGAAGAAYAAGAAGAAATGELWQNIDPAKLLAQLAAIAAGAAATGELWQNIDPAKLLAQLAAIK